MALLAGSAVIAGCNRPPQIDQENRQLIGSLRTAVSARKTDWLEQNSSIVEHRHAAGSLSDDQYAALNAIIEQARAGNWADAQAAAARLSKAQQPSTDSGGAPRTVNRHRHDP